MNVYKVYHGVYLPHTCLTYIEYIYACVYICLFVCYLMAYQPSQVI